MEAKKISENGFKSLRHSRLYLLSLAGGLAACALMVFLGYSAYARYRQGLIVTEQKQLLTMARMVGNSLVSYVGQELEAMDLYYEALKGKRQDEGSFDEAVSLFLDNGEGLYDAAACYDGEGRLVYQEGPMDFSYQWVKKEPKASICGKRIGIGGWYDLFVSRSFLWDQKPFTVVYAMNLNTIYSRIVAPVKIGEGGYSIVKDRGLKIIMHHAPDQIGIDAVYDRAARYPELDLRDLEEWVHLQEAQEEGTSVIRSYVWDDPGHRPLKRIVAYTTIRIQDETWIVNSTIPYEELDGPLSNMIMDLCGICGLFVAVLSAFIYAVTRITMKSEGQRREIAYLREINQGMELLRRKDEELQHYQRLQSIGQMSSHIAHEFNNYLTPIMIYAGLLEREESLGTENQELVKGLLDSAQQAADLSRRLLDFSRQDMGGGMQVVDLTGDVNKALSMLRHLTPDSVELVTEISREPLPVRGKRGMVEHILMNLCNNAFHAMEGGGGRLTVRLQAGEGSPWAVLSVSDTGCGISPDTMDRIFEPFYTTKRSGKGTGLGLSVVQNAMTAAGGRIEIDSEVGVGSTFRLYFARSEGGQDREGEPGLGRPGRVMVVDDDRQMLAALKRKLKSAGISGEFFDHPAAALSKLQNHKSCCDIILTDYSMPSMNGLEFAELVRRLDPSIRIILISGAEDGRFQWYLKNGIIDQFLLKTDIEGRLMGLLSQGKAAP